MSAQDQMRAMLDQLMGTARDGEVNRYNIRFDDSRVCKSFLMNCCPHDILASTRMDLGECHKHHDLALRADFEAASKLKDYFYDIDATEHLENFINDCDRRTEMAKRRLKETQEELSEEVANKINLIHAVGEQIGIKLAKAEEVGAQGNVEESLRLMEEVEDLKKAKSAAEADYRNTTPASSYQQQKLRVCEVCSAYLGIHDNDRRLADHFGGKLHVGFLILREKLDELRLKIAARREEREQDRSDRRKEFDRAPIQRPESPSPRRRRSNSRERRRSRSRDKELSSSSSNRNRRESPRRRSRERSPHDRRRSSHKSSKKDSRDDRKHSKSDSKSSSRKRSRSRTRRSRSPSDNNTSRSQTQRKRDRSNSRDKQRRSRSTEHCSPDTTVETGEAQQKD